MTYAKGPAKVPPGQDWPPVGWGSTYSTWDQRVKQWRRMPAKERRSCPLPRQMRDPAMLHVLAIHKYGEIKWSNGHGKWNYEKPKNLRRGFWTKNSYSTPRFIGETREEAMRDVQNYLDDIIQQAEREANVTLHKFLVFEEKNKMRVLDHIVDALEADNREKPSDQIR